MTTTITNPSARAGLGSARLPEPTLSGHRGLRSAARSIAAGWRRAERLPLRAPALRYIVCCQTQDRGGENQGVARGIYITLSLSIRPITSNRVGETEVR